MTKEEIELVNQIDLVLNYMNSFTGIPFKRLFEIQNELPTKINDKELIEILYKLEKDNYLHAETPSEHVVKNFNIDRQEIYYSTFQGRLFALHGGYLEEYKSLEAKKNWQKYLEKQSLKNARRLNQLTRALVWGTIAVIAWDMIKFFCFLH